MIVKELEFLLLGRTITEVKQTFIDDPHTATLVFDNGICLKLGGGPYRMTTDVARRTIQSET